MENTNKTLSITIVLSKYSDWFSWLAYYATGRGYTHAALSLDDASQKFYSFGYRGFCVDTMDKYRHRGVKNCEYLQLQVPENMYIDIKAQVEAFQANKRQYHFNRLGAVYAFTHAPWPLPFHRPNHYFCSQFVAELLTASGAIKLNKHVSLYMPNAFQEDLMRSPYFVNACTVAV
ncbi:MAG: hypothetical protein GX096_11025 [Clostridiales bacterium]|nr:hypothetical protein [Clostridiales bacterium]